MDVTNARVLLTGATGGIGAVLAAALADRGAQLILSGRREMPLRELTDRLGGRAIALDLAAPNGAAELLAAAGDIDILIANAGLPASGDLSDYRDTDVDRAIDVNLRAPIFLAKLAAEQMIPRGYGHLVFMSSLSGKSASARTALYNATKFGLRGFSLGLRDDLRPSGIGVSSIFPGPVRDAGMVAETRVKVPRAGTTTAAAVAAATIRAIEKNRAEVTVAPLGLRLATLVGHTAPDTAAALARMSGSDKIVAAISDGQRAKR